MSTQARALAKPAAIAGPYPPAPGDTNSEWRTIDADLTVVTAALDELARPLELRSHTRSPELHWYHHTAELELWVDISVRPDDRATTVGLSIRPIGAAPSRRPTLTRDLVVYGSTSTAVLLGLALLLVENGDIQVLLLIGLVDLIFMASVVFGFFILPARRLARAQQAWERTWRQSFWTALDARLSRRALYR